MRNTIFSKSFEDFFSLAWTKVTTTAVLVFLAKQKIMGSSMFSRHAAWQLREGGQAANTASISIHPFIHELNSNYLQRSNTLETAGRSSWWGFSPSWLIHQCMNADSVFSFNSNLDEKDVWSSLYYSWDDIHHYNYMRVIGAQRKELDYYTQMNPYVSAFSLPLYN